MVNLLRLVYLTSLSIGFYFLELAKIPFLQIIRKLLSMNDVLPCIIELIFFSDTSTLDNQFSHIYPMEQLTLCQVCLTD
jgi:hypothetical protein